MSVIINTWILQFLNQYTLGMLLGVPSFHYSSDLATTFHWDSSSDEEVREDSGWTEMMRKDRLRAGGSKYQNRESQGSQMKPGGLTRKSNSGNEPDTRGKTWSSCIKRSLLFKEDGEKCKNKATKPRKFAKLKKKLVSAKHSMFRQKKRKCCGITNVAFNNFCEEGHQNTLPLFKSSKSLNQSHPCLYVIPPKSNDKFQRNKSFLIPDLNLKSPGISVVAVNNVDIRAEEFTESKDGEISRKQMSENNVPLNSSVILYPVSLKISNQVESCPHLKNIKLLHVPPKYLENANGETLLQTKDTNSLPLFIGGSFAHHEEARETKTTMYLKKRRQFPRVHRQIFTKCDPSLYNIERIKSKYGCTNFEKSFQEISKTKQIISIRSKHMEGYGTLECEPEEKISQWSHLPKNMLSNTSQQSESVKYIFNKGFNEGDKPSTQFWLKRQEKIELEEKRALLDSTCLKTSKSTSIGITQEDGHIQKSAQRIYVLVMFCAVTCMQSIVSSTWSSITDSVMFAYPDCKARSVSLLSHWGSLCLLVSILPVCYLLHKKGLRTSMLIACGLCTLGAGMRCIPVDPDHFMFLAHVGSILNGIGGVVYGPAIVMVSSTWFTTNERTFATGVGTSLSMLGSAATYYLGPLIVSDPKTFLSVIEDAGEYTQEEIYYEDVQVLIQDEIYEYMAWCFITQLCFFIVLVMCFPDKPKYPTSKASSVSLSLNIPCLESLKILISNRQVALLSMSSALMNGVATPWLSLLSMTLTPLHISQSVAAHIGFWTIICGCVMSLAVSKLSDWYPGYLKQSLVTFGILSTLMFTWVSLMIGQIVPYTPDKLLVAIMIGISSAWATSPLFYELGAEVAYPAPESIVTGYLSLVTNLAVAIVNAFLYFFHSSDITWLSYALVLFSLGSTLCLILINAVYKRSLMDVLNR